MLHENPISSYETDNDCIIFQNSKTQADVHHRNNSENSSLAELSSSSSLLCDSLSLRKVYKNNSLNTTENLSKKCMLSSKKETTTLENSLEEDRENDTRFETNSECKTLDGMIIVVSLYERSERFFQFAPLKTNDSLSLSSFEGQHNNQHKCKR